MPLSAAETTPPSSKPVPERRTEETTITQIRGELGNVQQKLQPDVDAFLSLLLPEAKESKHTDLVQEHNRLGELLLQSLLRLDAIIAEGEWDEARKERKNAVREVQGLLDRLDGGWRSRTKA